MSRRTRLTATCLAIAALLFAPFATAAHACPFMGDAAAMQASGHQGAPSEAPPCAAHCEDGAASADLAKVATSAAPAPVSALHVIVPAPRAPGLQLPRPGDFLADPPAPLTRFTVLRI
jgi:hypothetical protein